MKILICLIVMFSISAMALVRHKSVPVSKPRLCAKTKTNRGCR